MPESLRGLLAVAGRVCLSTIFFMSAVGNKIPKFSEVAGLMGQAGVPRPKFMLAGAIVFLVVGSLSLMLGLRARFGALLLAIFLVLATYYFHAFWKETTTEAQTQQMIQFMKNLGLLGAMLLVMAMGSGPWSLDDALGRRREGVEPGTG